MDIQAIEVSFEPRVPVIGQILILEALEHLYSLFALAEVEWRSDLENASEWQYYVVSSPGKLLSPENALTVEYARIGSINEVLSGVVGPLTKFFQFLATYRLQVQQHQLNQARDKLQIVKKELLPLTDKLRKRGASEEQISQLVQRAYQFTDEVLAELMKRQKLQLSAIQKLVRPVHPCPTCGGTGALP